MTQDWFWNRVAVFGNARTLHTAEEGGLRDNILVDVASALGGWVSSVECIGGEFPAPMKQFRAEPVSLRADRCMTSACSFEPLPNVPAGNRERGWSFRAALETGLFLNAFGYNFARRIVGIEDNAQLDLVAGNLAFVLNLSLFPAH